jgi:hypothetical protein
MQTRPLSKSQAQLSQRWPAAWAVRGSRRAGFECWHACWRCTKTLALQQGTSTGKGWRGSWMGCWAWRAHQCSSSHDLPAPPGPNAVAGGSAAHCLCQAVYSQRLGQQTLNEFEDEIGIIGDGPFNTLIFRIVRFFRHFRRCSISGSAPTHIFIAITGQYLQCFW